MKMLNKQNINFQKIVEINAGAAIYLSGNAKSIKEGAEIAKKYINDGSAKFYIENLKN